jgi:branched-chain amino acid transport system permease protein
LAGAAVYVLLEHLLGGVSDYWQALLGLILLAIVIFAPGGLIGLTGLIAGRVADRGRRRAVAVAK